MQNISDWHSSQDSPGERKAHAYDSAVSTDGSRDNRSCSLYGYDFPLDVSQTITSLTLPKNPDIVILAITLSP